VRAGRFGALLERTEGRRKVYAESYKGYLTAGHEIKKCFYC
jgi:hypothetical protein